MHGPGDDARTKGEQITPNAPSGVQAVSPVRVSETSEINWVLATEDKLELSGPLEISHNMDCSIPVGE